MPDIDERSGKAGQDAYEEFEAQATALLSASKTDVLRLVDDLAGVYRDAGEEAEGVRKKITKAGNNRKAIEKLQGEIKTINKGRDKKIYEFTTALFGDAGQGMGVRNGKLMNPKKDYGDEDADRWKDYPTEFVRASELRSPAPAGHFLRQFGQSDRETIEAATTEPSVDQALTLLNSDIFDAMFNEDSKLVQDLAKATTPKERQDTLFLGILSRYPTDRDRELMDAQIAKDGEEDGFKNVAWALVNTQEFRFLQ